MEQNSKKLNKKTNEEKKELEAKPEKSFNEQRVRELSLIYYSQPEIKKAIYDFSQNRESVPRYYEAFGKRPNNLQYDSDIIEHVKKGATSFHCSEELWYDPLEISTELSKQELDKLRIGWDLLLDVDSNYLEYSKIYTKLLINALKFHGIENFAVKFSGNKGFHIIVPWKAFPNELYGQKTKDMFPEWPRVICQYLSELIKPKLGDKIFQGDIKELAEKTGKKVDELITDECLSCNRKASKKYELTYFCKNCSIEIIKLQTKTVQKCPECRKELVEKSRKEILFCEYCNFNSKNNPDIFARSKEKTEVLINSDLVLVAPRHLFRMPCSLHEKTALSSIVIDKEDIENFQINDAKPFKFEIKDFYPTPKINEAKELLLRALDWNEQNEIKSIINEKTTISKKQEFKDHKKIQITNPPEDIFPPQIKLILKGISQDGRKRALMILTSFFTSLGVEDKEIEKKIFDWNEKNYRPIKKGYILNQLNWYKKNKRLPPNFNNPIYKDLGVDKPDALALKTKNPVSYAVKKYFMMKK